MKNFNTILSVTTVVVAMLFVTIHSFAFVYTINFTGSGATTVVGNVVVQNLTQGTTVTVPWGDNLTLSDGTPIGFEQVVGGNSTFRVFQGADGKATVSFFAKQSGATQLHVLGVDGRKVAAVNQVLQAGTNSFELSLPQGIFVVQVQGNNFSYAGKVIGSLATTNAPAIAYVQATQPQRAPAATNTTFMTYNTGDLLLYKGISSNYSTIVTGVPTGDATINFEFVPCQDGDGNNYAVVKIGTQTWMAENLKYLPTVVGSSTGSSTTPYYYVHGYNGTDVTAAKATENYTTYGALYNWPAAMNGPCPTGWHLPTDAEWTQLTTYLGGENVAGGRLKATILWASPNNGATNETGFTALSGGNRLYYGEFSQMTFTGDWWSASENYPSSAWHRLIYYDSGYIDRLSTTKEMGYSVRCVKD